MISYCVAVYRPVYARLLIQDLIGKTTVPYEILLWLNVDDDDLDAFLNRQVTAGVPLRVVGKTAENIGMCAYPQLFAQAHYALITQIDDDVIAVSRHIAEHVIDIFKRFPRVRQLVADVWQDEYTTGARPPMEHYRSYSPSDGLYDGPIDGWFSVFHRSVLPLAPREPVTYAPVGGLLRNQLKRHGMLGLLCTRFKVFHVIGPQYASYFGMLDFEIEKYRRLGRHDIVVWYEGARQTLPRRAELAARVQRIRTHLEYQRYDQNDQTMDLKEGEIRIRKLQVEDLHTKEGLT